MPRVLIADDNSNVQKTVTLALKDAGIEVIAVGNGEAAVRKMPEINPDLVLADIFMPVRNGYEVCEFVKRDPRYMNTPVILLVGAFDPLDEREAQRVQADGVLKKPFVPPEPLVNLVTALLAKAAAAKAVVAVPASPVAQPAAVPAAKEAKPVPVPVAAAKIEEVPEPVQQPEESVSSPVAIASAETGETLAFSSLLEAPAPASGDETDPIVTARRDPNLGEPAFWTSPAVEEPTADELTEGHAWEGDAPRHSAPPMLGPEEPEEIQASEEPQASISEELLDVAVEFDAPQDAADVAQEVVAQESVEEESAPLVDTTHWTEAPPELAEAEPEAEPEAPSPALEPRESAWRRWAAETTAAPEEDTSTEAAAEAELVEPQAEALPEVAAVSEIKAAEDEPGETAVVAEQDEATHEVAAEPAETVVDHHAEAEHEHEEAFALAASPQQQPVAPAAEIPAMAASSATAIAVLSAVETAPAAASETVMQAQAVVTAEMAQAAVAPAEVAPVEEPNPSSSTACEKKVELLSVHEDFATMDELWKSAEPASPWSRAEPSAAVVDNSDEAVARSAEKDAEKGAEKEPASEAAPALAAVALQESKEAIAAAVPAGDARLQDHEFLEAVVERVIGRMQPRMIEIVTQEILRPVVEAMIRRELEKPQPDQTQK